MSNRNAIGGRRSSLTDLDADMQAKLIAEHDQRMAYNNFSSGIEDSQEIKMPSFGIEDLDKANSIVNPLTIGLSKL